MSALIALLPDFQRKLLESFYRASESISLRELLSRSKGKISVDVDQNELGSSILEIEVPNIKLSDFFFANDQIECSCLTIHVNGVPQNIRDGTSTYDAKKQVGGVRLSLSYPPIKKGETKTLNIQIWIPGHALPITKIFELSRFST